MSMIITNFWYFVENTIIAEVRKSSYKGVRCHPAILFGIQNLEPPLITAARLHLLWKTYGEVTSNEMNQSRVGGAITGLAVAIPFILLSTVTRMFVKLVWPADDKLFLDDYIIVFATVCFVSVPSKMIL